MTRASPIPHNRPTFGIEERRAAERVLKSGWVAQGREVEAFENDLCAFLGLPPGHAVALSSGTAALFLALWVLDAKGSAVACPVYACSALVNAIRFAGAEPRFVDTAPDGPNVDAKALGRTRAPFGIVAHMFGEPVDVNGVKDMVIIEDCAQSLGARIHQQPVGCKGRAAIFSFYATKMITSGGQGGMLVSGDSSLAAAARDFRQFDFREDRKWRFNFQMTDLQAAIGREQLKKLPSFVERRAAIFEQYREAGLGLMGTEIAGEPVRYRTVLAARDPREAIDLLARKGVKAIVPVEDWELLAEPEKFPNARRLSQSTVSLPTYPLLRDEDVSRVTDALTGLRAAG